MLTSVDRHIAEHVPFRRAARADPVNFESDAFMVYLAPEKNGTAENSATLWAHWYR